MFAINIHLVKTDDDQYLDLFALYYKLVTRKPAPSRAQLICPAVRYGTMTKRKAKTDNEYLTNDQRAKDTPY